MILGDSREQSGRKQHSINLLPFLVLQRNQKKRVEGGVELSQIEPIKVEEVKGKDSVALHEMSDKDSWLFRDQIVKRACTLTIESSRAQIVSVITPTMYLLQCKACWNSEEIYKLVRVHTYYPPPSIDTDCMI